MGRSRSLSATLGLGLALAAGGCSLGARAPSELSGLWSAGEAACAAGVGVRFDGDAIAAVYDDQREALFSDPIYQVETGGDRFQVRIRYQLPRRPGGAQVVGAHGVLVLRRSPGGGLEVAAHNLLDSRTGAARVRIVDDPAVSLLALKPCGDHPWREELRGRGEAY
jgi:hypothetical protein